MSCRQTCPWQENSPQRPKISKHILNLKRNHQTWRFWNLKSFKFNKIQSSIHSGNSLLLLAWNFKIRQILFQIRHLVTRMHFVWNVCLKASIHCWYHHVGIQKNNDWKVWRYSKFIQCRCFKYYKASSYNRPLATTKYQLTASDKVHSGQNQKPFGGRNF